MLDGLPRNSPSFRPSYWTPSNSQGTTQVEKYRFSPLLLVRCSLSTLELALWCFNLHNKASTGPRMCVGHSDTHSIPFTEQRKSVNPCQRERPLKQFAGVCIKVAPCFLAVRDDQRGQFAPLYFKIMSST
ncbi:hypothetical protein TNIN_372731 [Trichonephila inaurata madagascariensis]|uniref:Uncharacterized protein n=1 Tax=Trichonephila inaurata madagascariensis TaxID=2747483 RepID=A0A8X6WT97_9ARAC|nr:hypothetical protein TNIN_372731 [Trichonephila inaurata madagascariensis]